MNRQAAERIDSLWLAHWPGGVDPAAWQAAAGLSGHGPVLATCLRRLAFGLAPRPQALGALLADGELLTGTEAYRVLLEISAGLRSAVAGETNVFGQLRQAIAGFQQAASPVSRRRLQPLLDQLLRDTREIRSACLQGIGGQSWGTLVRRLLAPAPAERLLFVGAGELARSMLPLFRQQQTGLWARRPVDALPSLDKLFAPDAVSRAADWASHIVITTPADPDNDARWLSALARRPGRRVIHLGHRSPATLPAAGVAQLLTMADVLALGREQSARRAAQLKAARAACAERALRGQPGRTTAGAPALLATA